MVLQLYPQQSHNSHFYRQNMGKWWLTTIDLTIFSSNIAKSWRDMWAGKGFQCISHCWSCALERSKKTINGGQPLDHPYNDGFLATIGFLKHGTNTKRGVPFRQGQWCQAIPPHLNGLWHQRDVFVILRSQLCGLLDPHQNHETVKIL